MASRREREGREDGSDILPRIVLLVWSWSTRQAIIMYWFEQPRLWLDLEAGIGLAGGFIYLLKEYLTSNWIMF